MNLSPTIKQNQTEKLNNSGLNDDESYDLVLIISQITIKKGLKQAEIINIVQLSIKQKNRKRMTIPSLSNSLLQIKKHLLFASKRVILIAYFYLHIKREIRGK